MSRWSSHEYLRCVRCTGTITVTTVIGETAETAFYCKLHAPVMQSERGDRGSEDLRTLSNALHRMLDIMRREDRLPAVTEVAPWGGAIRPGLPGGTSNAEINAQIAFLGQFVSFSDTQGRLRHQTCRPIHSQGLCAQSHRDFAEVGYRSGYRAASFWKAAQAFSWGASFNGFPRWLK